jgi:flagellar biosynthesis protein FliP
MRARVAVARVVVGVIASSVATFALAFPSAHAATGSSTTTAPAPATTSPPPTIASPTVPTIVTPTVPAPTDSVRVAVTAPKGTSNPVLIVVLVTLASLVPGLLMVATTFPRFLIVLGLARQGLGLNQTPPNQVLTGLAAFLTLFAMAPVFSKINDVGLQPALKGTKTQSEAIKAGWEPLRDYLLDHTRSADLALLQDMSGTAKPATPQDVSPRVLIPAYIISEMRAAFTIGFLVWVPFLLIDLLVASVLSALGMMMMPPVVVSLPVKLVVFVLVDGWALLVGSLLRSVG